MPPRPLRTHRFRNEAYTVHVRLNDYLDIICPHYEDDTVAETAMEQYTLYLVEREQYQQCQPQSKDQVRWQCNQPSARHGPEKLSEKFQRFTPFTLGKEFKEGHSYYYICECPGTGRHVAWRLRERVHVLGTCSVGSQAADDPFLSWILFSCIHATHVQ